jgi:hypothetical protein
MRSVSARACGAALLILLVAVTPVSAFEDDPPPGTEAPERRLRPPVGVVSEGHIQPPVGITDPEEPPSVWELFLVWLQTRIHVPVG